MTENGIDSNIMMNYFGSILGEFHGNSVGGIGTGVGIRVIVKLYLPLLLYEGSRGFQRGIS